MNYKMGIKKTGAPDQPTPPKAPTMTRSRSQLSTSYAPGALFTFEGGMGACLSIPDQSERPRPALISKETAEQVHLRVREIWQNWFSRASTGGTAKHKALPAQCLDLLLLREGRFHPPSMSQTFELVDPVEMGYVPAPLAFACNTCQQFKSFDTAKRAAEELDIFTASNCGNKNKEKKGQCRWRQIDVVFIHWSGHWAPPSPGKWEWNIAAQELRAPAKKCWCGSDKFFLRDNSARIGQWFFECEDGHKDGDSWLQNDEKTTEMLGDECAVRPPRWRRMEPISYRASAVFYPHSEQFVIFTEDQHTLLSLLRDEKHEELAGFVAEKYGMGVSVPTVESMLEVLRRGGAQHADKVSNYEFLKNALANPAISGNPEMVASFRTNIERIARDWRNTPGLIPVEREVPAGLLGQVKRRSDFGSRYDPFTLAVEHEALKRSKLAATVALEGRAPFVRFNRLDKDLSPRTETLRDEQQKATVRLMAELGMADLGLIREFDLCRFTHGFTRMSNEPLIDKNDINEPVQYPVRLNLFPSLGNNKRPIYVVTQAHEAFYIQLNPDVVYAWLKTLGLTDLPEWSPAGDIKLGAYLLQLAQPFGKYFSELHPGPASTYRYVYTLLHT